MWRDEEYTVRGRAIQEVYDEYGQFVGYSKPLSGDWRKASDDLWSSPKIVAFLNKCREERETL